MMNIEKRASIDIGSNSCLLLIMQFDGKNWKELARDSEVTGLGRDLDKNGYFLDEAMVETKSALNKFTEIAKSFGINASDIIVTATEASRVSKNADQFFSEIFSESKLKINIITSKAEAYFSTKGILFNSNHDLDQIIIMDIGGASTELIKVNAKTHEIIKSISMPIGSVRATDWLKANLFVNNIQKIFSDFSQDLDGLVVSKLYCVAGTVTSLGNMYLGKKDFIEDDVHGLEMKQEDVDSLFKKYSQANQTDLLNEFPFLGKRSNSIVGGLHVIYHILHRLKVNEISISTYGLRYGSLLEGEIKNEYLHG
jgi:exopolyphosphatase/guanosine-5'-triphosphate,3'-diphosphate pyrophosphatase